jgi:dynein heavy chain
MSATLESIQSDERILWLRQKVLMGLDIPAEVFDQHFVDSLARARSAGIAREDITTFLSGKCGSGNALFFASSKTTEEVEISEEVEVENDEVVPVDTTATDATVTVDGEVPPTTTTDSSKDESKEGSNAEKAVEKPTEPVEGAPETPIEGGEEVPAVVEIPKKKTIIVKRMETRSVSILYMGLDKVTAEMSDNAIIFFIRTSDGAVPVIASDNTPAMLKHFEVSLINGDMLYGIANLMNQVYIPVITKSPSDEVVETSSDSVNPTEVDDTLRNELTSNMAKFEQQLRHVVQQSRGDVRLHIPSITIISIEATTKDYAVMTEIESALEDWTNSICSAVEIEHQKVKNVRSPLGEIDFWRERNAALSALYDQINMPRVQQMLQVMKVVDNPQLTGFHVHFSELSKLYLEAKDNVKFLTTLERHFKHLIDGTFQTILESMQSMVNGLRMVWVISRHYNTDDRMAPLMETIAETLSRRVRDEVRLSDVLAMDFVNAKRLVQEAKDVLALWNENYFRMRKRIEDSGSDHRWEFDRKALFGRTDYMSEICANILEIVEALDHFRVFLGPELKAVTGDSAGIDEVLKRVDGLTIPLKVPFEEKIFDKSYEKPWEAIMKRFRTNVAEIEKMTEIFIKESFRKLRSAEGAFELVQNFQKIGNNPDPAAAQGGQPATGSSLKQQISDRYKDILEQYVRELESIKILFNNYRDCPQIYKNFPPVAGAIAWARDLYHRAKRPILRFKKHGGLLEDEFGDQVKLNYLDFARSVDTYIAELYSDWETDVATVAVDNLKHPVLRSIASYSVAPKTNEKESRDPGSFPLPPPPYRVSFSHELKMIIKETRYLDKLGFRVPESALNVTLQESKYQDIIRSLNSKLHEYDHVMSTLKPIEKQLLKTSIDDLNTTIKIGFYPLNWTSQRIHAYIEDLNLALVRFGSVVSQVHKNASMIDDVISKISSTLLLQGNDFRQADGTLQAVDISEFYELMETRRVSRLEALVSEYVTIGESFLMKVEEVVAKTATGSSPVLAGYYHYWEKIIYNAIAQMIIGSMAALTGLLQCKDGPPLFKVTVSLNGKELSVSPPLTEVDKLLTKGVRNMAESARSFSRWMNGTCLITEPQIVNEDDEPYVFSFYQDIQLNPQVIKLALALSSQTNKVYSITNKYLDGWRRYDKVTNLWNPKRKQQVEKLHPTCANLDSAMNYFQGIKETVESQPTSKDIDFLQIDMSLVAIGVARQSEKWKNDYGEVLLLTSRSTLEKIQEKIKQLEEQVEAETVDLDELKNLLNIIGDIQAMTQDIELEMLDIIERYRTLQRYNIQVPEIETSGALSIGTRWRQLYCDSRTRDLRLVDTKDKFRIVTAEQDIEFRAVLEVLRKEFLDSGPGVSSVTLDQGVDLMTEYKRRVGGLNKQKAELINAQCLFNLDVKPYPLLNQTVFDLDQLDKIYGFYVQFRDFCENISSTMWSDLDIQALNAGADQFENDARKFPKDLKAIYTFKMVETTLGNFKDALPLIINLKNDALKTRHWQKVSDTTGVVFDTSLKSLTLGNIFSMELHNFAALIEEIINEAVNEMKIETELGKIEAAWRMNSLQIMKYKKDGVERGSLLRPADELKIELEDNMLNLQTIAGSRFVGAFVDRVRKWEKTLNTVSECLEIWFTVQRKWAYLEGIFIGAEDIRQQLPEEAKKFDAIDKSFKTIMSLTAKNPNVVDACTMDNRLGILNGISDRLDNCQKSLSDYLDTKRAAFPRFFFISDDELLSVLGNSDPTSIQIHLLKLFDNVKAMTFGRNNKVVEAMNSVEKEGFNFRTPKVIEGPVEVWMTGCEDEMHDSLQSITKEGVYNYASYERTEWLKLVLGMTGICGSQIWWTWEVEDTFRQVLNGDKYAMKALELKLTSQLNDLVAMVRRKLDNITRKKVNTLLIVDVHARDIVDGFVRESVLNAKEFAWESQLRFYWDRDVDDCVIRQCTGKFRYGYEYMGLNGRLVITPLTDRCYMTLSQALTFKLGGSPAGPAGTGKTETVKDLAKSVALPCFVINCGDGLDYKGMASIFNGLVRSGAWGCFDEFNRINIEVLSVVSAQIRSIQNALIYDKPTCDIGIGGDMLIKRIAGFATCGIFITMNPGYAGRTELPDNLKALFRPVTMIVPDFLQICEIMLFSEGFELAKMLAKKMTVLYSLSQQQLSKQYHYDFGLRALKSVLVMAGGLKRQYQDMPEDLVLMRCLRDSNLPKFVFEDVPLFLGLISDLFPGMDCPRVGYEELKDCAMQDLEARGFKCSDEKVFYDLGDKCIQMYETQLVRHTTMIVGPTGGGKSLVLETLRNSRLMAYNEVVKMHVINAKAQPLNELYGSMDPVTRDWTDGILSKLFRELNEPLPPGKENEFRWIVYDGDVDALWVENMNSVMDDNRLLTLPNGERIRLQSYTSMIMETYDLQFASPATISRCGMVWVDPQNLGYQPFYERWVRQRFGNGVLIEEEKQQQADNFIALFEKYVPPSIDLILAGIVDGEMGQKLKQAIPITNIDMVRQLCSVIDASLPKDITDSMDVEYMYIYSVMWSLGAALVGEARIRYDSFVKKISREALPDGILYDYFYSIEDHKWEKWQSMVTPYKEPSPFKFYEVMVPTTDSVLYANMLGKLAPLRPILFVGESGTAKTTIILKYLSELPSASFTRLNINFSSRTKSADVQNNIEANTDKRSGSVYGPPTGKKLIVFIDDLNMPKVDTYGTQQPIAFLHYLMGRGGCWDRGKDLNLKTIKDLQYIAAMGPPGGGRNPVDTRFIALFNVFNLNPPTQGVLTSIFSSIINSFYREFSEPVKAAVAKITPCVLKLYNFVIERMPPTPSKFHYIFNLRDISRVYEGMCNATTDIITTDVLFIRMWRNECDRIFSDRLTTSEDQAIFFGEIKSIITDNYRNCVDSAMKEPSLFGDFSGAVERLQSGDNGEDLKLYQDIGGYDDVRNIFQEVMTVYNQNHKAMTLVLFEQALEHLCRIHRIIRGARGNALLVGVGGSGKQSLSTLAAFCAGYKLFQITLSRGYGEEQFKEDLKELYKMLGTGEVVFLFTDAHVVEEGFLEFINNMLTTGMVPALYAQDEKDALQNTVRTEVKAAGLPETPDNLWNFYVDKCRNNLHIVLCMSPSGSKLRLRCRNFPGLVSNAVIDWFFPWPADALQKVAEFFLVEEHIIPDEHKAAVIKHLVFTHQQVSEAASRFAEELRRFYYVTPKNYLDFISNYRIQLKFNSKRITASSKRLDGGLQKLIEAASAVARMQVSLSEKMVVVNEKTEKVQELIKVIQEKSAIASVQQEEASVKQSYAEEQALIITKEKGVADEALMEALPAVEAASRALENLDKNDLTELKAFTNPPPAVMRMCMQLVILKPTGEKFNEDWLDAKKLLGNSQLLQLLKAYPKDDLTDKQVKKVNKYFDESLTLEKMQTVSKAGYGLLTWVCAILKYYEVAKNVAPLREKVKTMEKAQRQTEAELAQLQTQLAALSKEISELNAQFSEANGELDVLQSEAALMTKRLAAASKLIDGLTGERTRWGNDVKSLGEQSVKLVGDCLLGSSFLSYVGAFTTDYRKDLIYDKFQNDVRSRNIPISPSFTLEGLLTTDSQIQSWVGNGLPADDHSVQNGMLTNKCSRFPLCIDPQQQAVGWIKRTYAGKNLSVKELSNSDFMKHLELAIQFGNPFLFQNIDEELDPMLDPVLEKNIVKEGAQYMIKLGDKMVEWDDNFRLFFTTKLANPHYSPEVMGKTMIINYGVTMDGLANQLLNVVVANERPDLERQWKDLVEEMGQNAQLLVSLEDTLLRELSSSSGNILDNQELISTLENTKSAAVDIALKLSYAEVTKGEISTARAVYKPVAKRGSILYFAEAGLATINSMYEISLDSFLGVFKGALETSKKDSVLENRLRNMVETVMRQVYDYTCIGIFERHKLMFSFQMTSMVMNGEGTLELPILDFFLKGDTSLEGVSEPSPVNWLMGSGWKDLLCLGAINETFGELLSEFKGNTQVWKDWYDLEAPEFELLPCGFTEKISPLGKLAVCRCFRPDRVYNAVKLFVMEAVGEKFVQPPVLDYSRIYAQSTCTMPMVFILSPGADPQSDIQKFCDEMGMASRFKFVSLGQGQGPIAEQLLDVGHKRGHWVLLQNCHLLASWLKVLEKTINEMKDPHKDFRLWLTTDPTDRFPLGILQRSLKVVTEPPDGLKLNMRATYSRIDTATFEECPHWAFRPCMYVLAFLHAVVLERRKYGKIGWNVNYDFNESDLNISRRLVSLYLAKAFEDGDEFLPWGSLKYLIGDAMYGGRVSDNMDRRILNTYLEEYMGDFLFDDCQKFKFSDVGFVYEMPEWGDLENYSQMVETLPLVNSPAVFGLHPNAEIGYYSNAVKGMWMDLISLQPRRSGGGVGMSREDYIGSTARDVFNKIPLTSMDIGSYDLMQIRAGLCKKNNSDTVTPSQVVLLQELERWNKLVIKMSSSLMDLQRALVGEIGMSDELDALGDSIFNGFLPPMWRRLAPATEKPLGGWMTHYSRRYKQYAKWISDGEPAVIWIAGLHIPGSYLSALVQTTCRMKKWPLDKSTLYTVVTTHVSEEGLECLESGCYVSGLYLEGGAWDSENAILRVQDPKVLVTQIPIMQVIPVEASKLKLHGTFRTPVYVTQQRKNAMGVGMVFEADLATHEHISHWVLQGVCLVLNIDS